MLPKSWNKSFNSVNMILTSMRFCEECNDKIICVICYNLIDEIKEIEANINY